jgi:hypothetical protein
MLGETHEVTLELDSEECRLIVLGSDDCLSNWPTGRHYS